MEVTFEISKRPLQNDLLTGKNALDELEGILTSKGSQIELSMKNKRRLETTKSKFDIKRIKAKADIVRLAHSQT